jgi:hypothetical protein
MANKIQLKRGLVSDLPTLSAGEPAFTTDTNNVYVGNGTTNIQLAKQTDLDINTASLSDMMKNYYSLNDAIEILEGSDLDETITFGNYYCTSATISITLLNCPVTLSGFEMKVERITGNITTYRRQTILANSLTYVRECINGTYTIWRLVVTSDYLTDTLLFSGSITTAGTTINLAAALSEFQYIIFEVDLLGLETRTFKSDLSSYILKSTNLANSGTSKTIQMLEMSITEVSSTSLKVAYNYEWTWSDTAQTSYSSPIINNASTDAIIKRIWGRK